MTLKDLVGKHNVGVVAIGNGTACRETEELIAEIIAEGTRFSQGDGDAAAAGVRSPADRRVPRRRRPRSPKPDRPRPKLTTPAVSTPEAIRPTISPRARPSRPPSRQRAGAGRVPLGRPRSRHRAPAPAQPGRRGAPGKWLEHRRARRRASRTRPPPPRPRSRCCPRSPAAPRIPTSEGGESAGHGADRAAPAASTSTGTLEADLHVTHHGGETQDPGHTPSASETSANETASAGGHFPVPDDWEPEGSEPAGRRTHPWPRPTSAEAIAEQQMGSGPVEPAAEPAATGDHLPTPGESSGDAVAHARGGDRRRRSRLQPPRPTRGRRPRLPRRRARGGLLARASHRARGSPSRAARVAGQAAFRAAQPPSPPRPHPADAQLAQLAYVIVNEAGASVYSTSQVGRDELPELRRDPARAPSRSAGGSRIRSSELVKIEPQNIGVGLYQHDVNPKQLKETLESVIASCVNFVGVDLNTASVPLLRHVSGLNQLTARRIVDYRKEHGAVRPPRAVDGGRRGRPGDVHPGGRLPQARSRARTRWTAPGSTPRAIRPRSSCSRSSGSPPTWSGTRSGCPSCTRKLAEADVPALAAELERRRVHAPRHHRGPRPARARPARRPAQADLQEGRPQARGPDRRHGAEGDRPERRGLRRLRRHRPEGFGPGAHQPARQPVRQEPARRGERRRRGHGLGDGRGPGAEAGLADDGQAGHRAASRPARRRRRRRRAARAEPGSREPRPGPGPPRTRRRTRAAPARLGPDVSAGRCAVGRHPGRGPGSPSGSGTRPGSRPRPCARRPGRPPAVRMPAAAPRDARPEAPGTDRPPDPEDPTPDPAAVGPVVSTAIAIEDRPRARRPAVIAPDPRLPHSPRTRWPATSRCGPSGSSSSSGKRGSKDRKPRVRTPPGRRSSPPRIMRARRTSRPRIPRNRHSPHRALGAPGPGISGVSSGAGST